ncbi:MAG: cysteine hydrolase [Flavobacteriales bacterium]|nr:cysteine hydrolase [Flavobacteriales bacterium]
MKKKAIILIGFQKDYFDKDGILHGVVEESLNQLNVLEKTINVIKSATEDGTMIISTPIIFSENYNELVNPIGILSTIKDVGAFKANMEGSKTIESITQFKNIIEIPGKQGLNAFVNTNLEQVLLEHGIEEVVLAGCVCSICIDSTGRSATEKGFSVTMLSDCISSRTMFEHQFYMEEIFPLYAKVSKAAGFVKETALITE